MENNQLYTYSVENNEATITKRNAPAIGEVTIPSEIDGYPVVCIESGSFGSRDRLTKITIPDSLTSLRGLFDVNCPMLEEIVVSENNPVFSSEDGVLFSKDKTRLLKYPSAHPRRQYRVPDSVKGINPFSAFDLYCRLTDFTVGENSEFFSVRDGVLFSKDGTVLIKYPAGKEQTSYRVPDGVERLKMNSFYGAKYLTQIVLSASVKSAEDFRECSRLTEILVDEENPYLACADGILFDKEKERLLRCPVDSPVVDFVVPETVKEIDRYAFLQCHNLKSFAVSEKTKMEEICFRGCTSLETLVIGGGKPEITNGAFLGCFALKSIALPAGEVCISKSAFRDCAALEEIRFAGTKQQWEQGKFYPCNDVLQRATVYFDCDLDSMIAAMKN